MDKSEFGRRRLGALDGKNLPRRSIAPRRAASRRGGLDVAAALFSMLVGAGVVAAGALLTMHADEAAEMVKGVSTFLELGCNIKGNISLNSGEYIFHVPGQEHYDETIIRPSDGERWFCSEADARAAGWRKARR
jgi:hypothetical protein